MLLNVHVKNFALIDEAEMDLGPGLNVLTGETGAGKSILIDAVSAALGGRLRGDVIGPYGESAYVELVFSVEDGAKRRAIEDMGISTEYDCILVSRRIGRDRSVHRINDETVTAARVREVTELLLDLHGQHEHQSLLRPSYQLDILDRFAEDNGLREAVRDTCRAFREAEAQLGRYGLDEAARIREADLIRYEIAEIEGASLRTGEIEELDDALRRYKNSEALAGDISKALELLDDGREAASDKVSTAVRYLRSAAQTDPSLAGMLESAETMESLLSDSVRELRDYALSLDYDPEELRAAERRLDEIHHLESKYGRGYEGIMDALAQRRSRITELENYEAAAGAAREKSAAAAKAFESACSALSAARRSAAGPLAGRIRDALDRLGFMEVHFDISIEDSGERGENGADRVCFLVSLNPGMQPGPLASVASGGELSRIMLGVKSVLADRDDIPTLIFDEIDAGISGRTARLVAGRLAAIARYHQVICITHLPQIAAGADAHFLIEKSAEGGLARTRFARLDAQGEIAELARLLGGSSVSQAAIENARELKKTAREEI